MVELDFHTPARVERLTAAMEAARHGRARTWLHRRLRRFFSDFDVNAWLGMYPMTFLTTEEWRALVPSEGGRLLDVGAGSGDLTRALAPLFSQVICTETSRGMVAKLRRAGWDAHELDLADAPLPVPGELDAVTMMHVLDRCRAPLTLFDRALSYLRPGGTVVVAITLPYEPMVDVGGRTVEPDERLVPRGVTDPDEARGHLESTLFAARGLSIERVARVPYLCPGDSEVPYYTLDSYVFVARKPALSAAPQPL